jgi:hypothetical protein
VRLVHAEPGPVRIVAVVEQSHLDRIGQVVLGLAAAGLEIAEVRPLGIVTGAAPEARVDAIRATDGVFRVEVLHDPPNGNGP